MVQPSDWLGSWGGNILLTLMPEAIQYIKEQQQPIFLDHPPLEGENRQMKVKAPAVRFGMPQQLADFNIHQEQGVTVYIPRGLELVNITIELSKILFIKKLMARIAVGKKMGGCC